MDALAVLPRFARFAGELLSVCSSAMAEGRRIERPALRPPKGSNLVADLSAVPSMAERGGIEPQAVRLVPLSRRTQLLAGSRSVCRLLMVRRGVADGSPIRGFHPMVAPAGFGPAHTV